MTAYLRPPQTVSTIRGRTVYRFDDNVLRGRLSAAIHLLLTGHCPEELTVEVPDPGDWQVVEDPDLMRTPGAMACRVESPSTGWAGFAALENGVPRLHSVHITWPCEAWTA